MGLAEYAEMTEWLGNTASAAWARGLWEQARDGYEDFWEPARGSYVEHIVAGEGSSSGPGSAARTAATT
jgi:alpha-L-rhamnosidase